MADWYFPRLTDYWDNQNQNNIFEFSQIIGFYNEETQTKLYNEIRERIFELVAAMNDEQLCYAAFIIADDLYKSANEIGLFKRDISNYLEATAGTFFDLLKQRGYCLHYLANTLFAGSAAEGFIRPLKIFRRYFGPSGITYICPHEIALDWMQKDGLSLDDYDQNIDRYLEKAQADGDQRIAQCDQTNDHYFNLQIDGDEKHFMQSFARVNDKGIITVFRSEPPLKGTTCNVIFPQQRIR